MRRRRHRSPIGERGFVSVFPSYQPGRSARQGCAVPPKCCAFWLPHAPLRGAFGVLDRRLAGRSQGPSSMRRASTLEVQMTTLHTHPHAAFDRFPHLVTDLVPKSAAAAIDPPVAPFNCPHAPLRGAFGVLDRRLAGRSQGPSSMRRASTLEVQMTTLHTHPHAAFDRFPQLVTDLVAEFGADGIDAVVEHFIVAERADFHWDGRLAEMNLGAWESLDERKSTRLNSSH